MSAAQAQSLLSDRERNDMLAACRVVPTSYRPTCEDAVKSGKVSANVLRWCAHTIQNEADRIRTANASGNLDVSRIKEFAGATICRGGLKAAGYRVP